MTSGRAGRQHSGTRPNVQVPTLGEGRPKGGHALAILPRLTHYNIDESPLFAAVTLDFLEAEQP